jgi:GH15 family glucan-1,4-alpha-glucosidase
MPSRIEDYALLGDCQTCALVARDGSIDWLCFPHFDSPSCFTALLGTPDHGRWLIAPAEQPRAVRRRYREGTLVLETEYETDSGTVTLIDFMPVSNGKRDLIRIVAGKSGRVPMKLEIALRFDYGSIVPWVQRVDGGITAIGGPDAVVVQTPVHMKGEEFRHAAQFTVGAGDRVPFVMTWHPSHEPAPDPADPEDALEHTTAWWQKWSARCKYKGPHKDLVLRSLITLKAMTFSPSGGTVAAVTTSLPEQLGGVRNWDYRFCWLRDSTFMLYALMEAGYVAEADAWRKWLLRAVAGEPSKTNIMYGIYGERRLSELELPWLPGYEGAKPVRTGNAASKQFQLDVYGEVLDSLYQCRKRGLAPSPADWDLEKALLRFVETACHEPDEGIWEVRGPRRHFTHSKIMAWVALDRGVRAVEEFGVEGPADRWRQVRDELHAEICERGFSKKLNAFVQSYDTDLLDASLLMIPQVGFLPASDPRVAGTVEAIEKGLMKDGFVQRYDTSKSDDGLPPGEGAFLPCTFWLADCYCLLGRKEEAKSLFKRLVGLCNDVGLISEEYDPRVKRLVGNFPQAFTHVGLVNTAMNLSSGHTGAAEERAQSS